MRVIFVKEREREGAVCKKILPGGGSKGTGKGRWVVGSAKESHRRTGGEEGGRGGGGGWWKRWRVV